jgi:uncharacterized protein with PIN domain
MSDNYFTSLLNTLHEAIREWQETQAELAELRATLSAPRPAPRCPKCGSTRIGVYNSEAGTFSADCWACGEPGRFYETLDAALDAWRPKP